MAGAPYRTWWTWTLSAVICTSGLCLGCSSDDPAGTGGSAGAGASTGTGGTGGGGHGGDTGAGGTGGTGGAAGPGVLRVSPDNPRYFTDDSGNAIFLTGAHTWMNLQDFKADGYPDFDWGAYLDFLEEHNHNFIRLWVIEYEHDLDNQIWATPSPYLRTGPANAYDGRPQYDLTQFDDTYFDRLRARALEAQSRGMVVSVMLFSSFAAGYYDADQQEAWLSHPYREDNNVNGVDADADHDGRGGELHTLADPDVTAAQEALVRRTVDAVQDVDSLIFEIGNEMAYESVAFQYHMISLIHDHEASRPRQHAVGMTTGGPLADGGGWQSMSPAELLDSPAQWISPADTWGDVTDDPPATDGQKVVILDTDHIPRPEHGDWVWKCLCRGYNPILMDVLQVPYPYAIGESWNDPDLPLPRRMEVRDEMGQARRFATRMDLVRMVPHDELSSTSYCLANPGVEYLVYQPSSGSFTVDLTEVDGSLALEWFNPSTDETLTDGTITGGAERTLDPPSGYEADVVAYLH